MANDTHDDHIAQSSDRPEIYELRVDGRLGKEAYAWFEDMNIQVDESPSPVQTVIRGEVPDEAALYGLISRIRDLGLTLLSVNRVEPEHPGGGEETDLSNDTN
jgi:hypothetical protein